MIGKIGETEVVSKEIVQSETNPSDIPLLDSMYNKLQDFFSNPLELSKEKIELDDGTMVTSPSSDSSTLKQNEVGEGTDLFAEFGIDVDEFLIGFTAEPVIVASPNLDFLTEFNKYAREDLYTHCSTEKCEYTRIAGPNCMAYAYGISKELDGCSYDENPCPGHFAGLDTSAELSEVMVTGPPVRIKKIFEYYMKLDFQVLGKELKEVESNEYQPQAGERMFALVTAPSVMGYCSDFHFYVKDKNGYWSHKPGTTNPTIFDNSGCTIKDPEKCDRGDYTNFVGYYVIKDK